MWLLCVLVANLCSGWGREIGMDTQRIKHEGAAKCQAVQVEMKT